MGSFDKWADKLNKLNERFGAEQPKKEAVKEAVKKKADKEEKEQTILELLERLSEIESKMDALDSRIYETAKLVDKTRAAYAKKEDLKAYVTKKTFEAYKEEQEKTLEKFMESLENLGDLIDADE